MGLSKSSVGMGALDAGLEIHKKRESDIVAALAGNPNVGKSTLFNAMTGLRQHTGNWAGKTVASTQGYASYEGQGYVLVDIPGCYSLDAHSSEEEVARDFLYSGEYDVAVVVCDAMCLERNMRLVLQVLERTRKTVVCVNLMDEAEKKHINIDLEKLEDRLGIPVVGTAARSNVGIEKVYKAIRKMAGREEGEQKEREQEEGEQEEREQEEREQKEREQEEGEQKGREQTEREEKEREREEEEQKEEEREEEEGKEEEGKEEEGKEEEGKEEEEKEEERKGERKAGKDDGLFGLRSKKRGYEMPEEICKGVIEFGDKEYVQKDRKKDKFFTGRLTGIPVMLFLLFVIFWLTIVGTNYPSELLRTFFVSLEEKIMNCLCRFGAPEAVREMLVYGMYRVLAWVVSVMLPPMAIFFPLFTILEDSGYLPRVAFNLDKCFKKCNACGKQALTMCMGFGCNAAGVVGCRIIDSPRERLIAVITNSFVPCNGRFPTLIAIITMFFAGGKAKASFGAALMLTGIVLFGIGMTFLVSWFLSVTFLKGMPSSFVLEMPPYRRPQIGRVIVRSVLDRTMFVLGRAILAAAPAGILLWLLANCKINDATILSYLAGAFDAAGRMMGMDGVILLAFILGLPANEIVVPIMIMAYLSQGSLMEINDTNVLKQLLIDNGWTWATAVSAMLFTLVHWPCATTCLTIRKETGSLKWTVLSFLLPAVLGCLLCVLFHSIVRNN